MKKPETTKSKRSAPKQALAGISYLADDGTVSFTGEYLRPRYFGGFLPAIGDEILAPLLPGEIEHEDIIVRRVWTIVRRLFVPRNDGEQNYTMLIVKERNASESDKTILHC